MFLPPGVVLPPVPRDAPARIAAALAERGFNAEAEAVTLLAGATDTGRSLDRVVAEAPDDALTLTAAHVRAALGTSVPEGNTAESFDSPPETKGSDAAVAPVETAGAPGDERPRPHPTTPAVEISNDVTGHSTGTGAYEDFVDVFRDRYERLARLLRPRVNHRPTAAVADMTGGAEASIIGMVSDIRSTANGHRLVELEDTAGTFPCLFGKDSEVFEAVDELLLDEVVAVEGRLADDAGILFADAVHFPDVPRTFSPSTAQRPVEAALISDLHVGSHEFAAGTWERFADWLASDEAERVEYLLIAGDMVEGVGVYPGQEEELSIVDIYDQYEAFSERLKAVPGDVEIVMIPGNHDAVRLAEPQPAFDDELRSIVAAHDARVTGNPSVVTVEGVDVLMYHGVSLDEVIAEVPSASYDEPHTAMYRLLRKRHLAPQFGERTRVAPEERDYLVIESVPDVFHAGHVHKLGCGRYHNVTVVNSGCWQDQTAFQRRVNIDPDVGYAPILDLETLDVTIRKFT